MLRTACLRSRLDAQRAQAVVEQINRLPLRVDRRSVLRSELLTLSLRFGSSSHDAAYLEPALRLQRPAATTGGALRKAALACGVAWVTGV